LIFKYKIKPHETNHNHNPNPADHNRVQPNPDAPEPQSQDKTGHAPVQRMATNRDGSGLHRIPMSEHSHSVPIHRGHPARIPRQMDLHRDIQDHAD